MMTKDSDPDSNRLWDGGGLLVFFRDWFFFHTDHMFSFSCLPVIRQFTCVALKRLSPEGVHERVMGSLWTEKQAPLYYSMRWKR